MRGINPVGGVEIDGTKTRFFRISDVINLSMGDVFLDGATFKANGDQKFSNSFISKNEINQKVFSLVDVMALLGITLPQVITLMNKNFLCRVPAPTLQVMVSKTSVDAYYKIWKDERLVEIREAAFLVGETKMQFLSRWVKSRIVKIKDIGLRKCVNLDEIERVKNIKKYYVVTADCPKMWFVGRFTLPNFEERGVIKARRVGVGGKLRMYRRSEVERLLGPCRGDGSTEL